MCWTLWLGAMLYHIQLEDRSVSTPVLADERFKPGARSCVCISGGRGKHVRIESHPRLLASARCSQRASDLLRDCLTERPERSCNSARPKSNMRFRAHTAMAIRLLTSCSAHCRHRRSVEGIVADQRRTLCAEVSTRRARTTDPLQVPVALAGSLSRGTLRSTGARSTGAPKVTLTEQAQKCSRTRGQMGPLRLDEAPVSVDLPG